MTQEELDAAERADQEAFEELLQEQEYIDLFGDFPSEDQVEADAPSDFGWLDLEAEAARS